MARENPDLDNELLALLYDELPPEEAEAARARIAADPERAERLQAWQAIRAVAATLPVPEPDPQLHYDILRAARLAAAEAETPSPFWRWLQGLTLVPALAGAAAIVAAAGLTVMLTRQVDEAPIPRDNAATAVIAEMPPAANEDQTETKRGEEKLTEVPERARPEPENLKLDDAIGGFVAAGDKAGPPEPEPAPAEPAFAEPKATKPQQKGVAELKSKLDAFKDGMPAEEVADDEVVRFAEKTKKRESRAKPKAAAVADGRKFAPPPPADEARPEPPAPTVTATRAPAPATPPPAPQATPAQIGGEAVDERTTERAGDDLAAEPAAGYAEAEYAEQPARRAAADAPSSAGAAAGATRERGPAPVATLADADNAPEGSATGRSAGGDGGDLLQRARAAQNAGDHRGAVRDFESWLGNNRGGQGLDRVWFETALSYERLGETTRAAQLYRLAANAGGPYAERARARLAVLSQAQGDEAQAAEPVRAKARPAAAPAPSKMAAPEEDSLDELRK